MRAYFVLLSTCTIFVTNCSNFKFVINYGPLSCPQNYLTFKRIFGEHPDLLIGFLNVLMSL